MAERTQSKSALARYGGDEFAVLMTGMGEQEAVLVAEQMRNAISAPCSAGITGWHAGESASLMVSRADVGLYRAKETGRNRTVVETSHQPLLAAELIEAIEQDYVDVHFQPIVSIADAGRIVGFEALLRWSSLPRRQT